MDHETFEVGNSDKMSGYGKIKWDFYEKIQSQGYESISKQRFDDLYDDLSFVFGFGNHEDVQKEIIGMIISNKYIKFCKVHGFYDG